MPAPSGSDPRPDTAANEPPGESQNIPPDEMPVIVGKVVGQYGVKGWIKVYSYTRPVEQILTYGRWMLAKRRDAARWRPVRVASARQQSNKLLAKLAGINDRDAAGGLTGEWIAIRPSQLPHLPEGEYYWSDLTGLTVVNQDGVELGIVDHLVETGANDVLAVRRPGPGNAQAERLLPWSPEVVVEVDVEGGLLRVEWDADD